jgi:hypothetical protein
MPDDFDDDYSFPAAKYPGREAATMFLCFIMVVSLIVWGIWKLCH